MPGQFSETKLGPIIQVRTFFFELFRKIDRQRHALTPANSKWYPTQATENSVTPEFDVNKYHITAFPYSIEAVHIIWLSKDFFEPHLKRQFGAKKWKKEQLLALCQYY